MLLRISICLVLCMSESFAQSDADIQTLETQIVGGQSVNIESYPHQISLMLDNSHRCGGSIVSKLYIVTASHCVVGLQASRLTIRAGSSFLGNGGVVKSVASFKTHPNYNTRNLDYDVAVMKLSSALAYTSAIKKISLATTRPAAGSIATVSGWGANRRGGAPTYQLQAVQVPIVSQTTCKSRYSAAGLSVTDRMLCAGYLYVGGKDSCQGDSGGPLTYGGLLVGIVSWGTGTCGSAYYPSVYGSVPNLYTWITQNVVLDS